MIRAKFGLRSTDSKSKNSASISSQCFTRQVVIRFGKTLSVYYRKPTESSRPGAKRSLRLIDLDSLENFLGNFTPRSLENWRKRGLIPYIQVAKGIIRYSLTDIAAALRKNGLVEASKKESK
jgi:hypothetical protein